MQRSLVFAVLACLCWGVAPLFEKLGLRQANPIWAIIVRSSMTTAFMVSFVLFRREALELKSWSLTTWSSVLLGGVFSVLLAQAFYFEALRSGEVGKVVPVVGAYPLVSALLAMLFLGESLTIGKICGAALVVVGVWLLA